MDITIYQVEATTIYIYDRGDPSDVAKADSLEGNDMNRKIVRALQGQVKKVGGKNLKLQVWDAKDYYDKHTKGLQGVKEIRAFYYLEKEIKRTGSLMTQAEKLRTVLEKALNVLGFDGVGDRRSLPTMDVGGGWKWLDSFDKDIYIKKYGLIAKPTEIDYKTAKSPRRRGVVEAVLDKNVVAEAYCAKGDLLVYKSIFEKSSEYYLLEWKGEEKTTWQDVVAGPKNDFPVKGHTVETAVKEFGLDYDRYFIRADADKNKKQQPMPYKCVDISSRRDQEIVLAIAQKKKGLFSKSAKLSIEFFRLSGNKMKYRDNYVVGVFPLKDNEIKQHIGGYEKKMNRMKK